MRDDDERANQEREQDPRDHEDLVAVIPPHYRRPVALGHTAPPTFPVFSVLSHVSEAPRISETYAENVIAHSKGP